MADLAVIADCGRTRDKGRLERLPGERQAFPWIEMETTFVVREVLKAVSQDPVQTGGRIRLRHYRPDFERWQKEHPPAPGMPPPGVVGNFQPLSLEEGQEYILFLRRAPGRLYEPLSGHAFPASSVHRFLPGDRP